MSDREKITEELRWRVLRRDNCTCRYCGSLVGPFVMDHVYPVSKGGETSYENLVTSCVMCNLTKSDKVGIWPNPIFSGYYSSSIISVTSEDWRKVAAAEYAFIASAKTEEIVSRFGVSDRTARNWRKNAQKETK